ncbi:aminoglycoside phosphotransferase family protein [Frankia sp. Cpl3]|uniref:phosphotransferase family protein n=1 Tax=Parafrankia colletiae TaxID=573497 RepID=UPI000A8598C3|nr:phosphotransferase [Parafrankia colletiae]MCK9898715.1 aminoglycoside phosphotransferase family protein [Frankia sp. Cpl3]
MTGGVVAGDEETGEAGEAGPGSTAGRRGDITLDELTRPGGDVLTDRKGRLVVRHGDIVVKTHLAEEEPGPLLARLRLAGDRRLAALLLPPLRIRGGLGGLLATVDGRLVSAWPAATALRPDEVERRIEAAPWSAAAELLARLHTTDLTAPGASPGAESVPPAAVCARLHRSLDRLAGALATVPAGDGIHRLAADVQRAYETLPPWLGQSPTRPGARPALIHGDWHLGQVVQATPTSRPGDGPGAAATDATDAGWRIIDVDDLGWGDPAWDLARPAAWFAAGLLPPEVWAGFLDAYLAAGGIALGPGSDPWAALDGPARAVTVQYAAGALTDRAQFGTPLDEGARAFLDCAGRLAAGA